MTETYVEKETFRIVSCQPFTTGEDNRQGMLVVAQTTGNASGIPTTLTYVHYDCDEIADKVGDEFEVWFP